MAVELSRDLNRPHETVESMDLGCANTVSGSLHDSLGKFRFSSQPSIHESFYYMV